MARYKLRIEGPDGSAHEEPLPSVTEMIDKCLAKKGLEDWYYKQAVNGFASLVSKYGGNLPSDIRSLHSLMSTEGLSPYATRDAAADKGSKIHRAVEALARGRRPRQEYPALVEWWTQKGLKKDRLLGVEQIVYSGVYGYAGKLDLAYVEFDDPSFPNVLADIKTGKPRDSHKLQLELYRRAWVEMGFPEISYMQIIEVPRDGSTVTEHSVPITRELTSAADGLLNIWRWRK
jgi:hypothetical protein